MTFRWVLVVLAWVCGFLIGFGWAGSMCRGQEMTVTPGQQIAPPATAPTLWLPYPPVNPYQIYELPIPDPVCCQQPPATIEAGPPGIWSIGPTN